MHEHGGDRGKSERIDENSYMELGYYVLEESDGDRTLEFFSSLSLRNGMSVLQLGALRVD